MPSQITPPGAPTAPPRARIADTLMELAGVAAIAGFFWFVWPPAPLAVVGLYLFVGGNARAARGHPLTRPRLADRLARAAGAYLAAYRSGP